MARKTPMPQTIATWNNPEKAEKSTDTATALIPKNTRIKVPSSSPAKPGRYSLTISTILLKIGVFLREKPIPPLRITYPP
jgi:hypothetical protein